MSAPSNEIVVTIGDEVEIYNGPILGGTDTYFVTSLHLCSDGRVQCGFAKANTSLCSAPQSAILRKTGKRWTDEERAKIVAHEKETEEFIAEAEKIRQRLDNPTPAKTCTAETCIRDDEHRTYVCDQSEGHSGPHTFRRVEVEWTDATTTYPEPGVVTPNEEEMIYVANYVDEWRNGDQAWHALSHLQELFDKRRARVGGTDYPKALSLTRQQVRDVIENITWAEHEGCENEAYPALLKMMKDFLNENLDAKTAGPWVVGGYEGRVMVERIVDKRRTSPGTGSTVGADVICDVLPTEARDGRRACTSEENAQRIADALNAAEGKP